MTVVLPDVSTEVSVSLSVNHRRLASSQDEVVENLRSWFGVLSVMVGVSAFAVLVGRGMLEGYLIAVAIVAIVAAGVGFTFLASKFVGAKVHASRVAYTEVKAKELQSLLAEKGWSANDRNARMLLSSNQGYVVNPDGVDYFCFAVTFFTGWIRLLVNLDDEDVQEQHRAQDRDNALSRALDGYRAEQGGVLSAEREQGFVDGFVWRSES